MPNRFVSRVRNTGVTASGESEATRMTCGFA